MTRMLTVLRLPAVAALALVFRQPLLNAVEQTFDLVGVTLLAIDIGSTPASRVLVAVGIGIVGAATAAATTRSARPWALTAATLALSAVAVALVTGSGPVRMAPVGLLLLTNLVLPNVDPFRGWLEGRRESKLFHLPGTELLWAGDYLAWLREQPAHRLRTGRAVWPAILLIATTTATLVNGRGLVPLEQSMRMASGTRVIARGDFNGLSLDAEGRYLFATGHGLERVQRYRTDDLAQPPIESSVPTGRAQGLDYDRESRRLYVYDAEDSSILVLDDDLAVSDRLSVTDLAPGDPWIVFEPRTGTVTIASEADVNEGTAMLVLDAKGGRVRAGLSDDPGNLLRHPDQALIYMSFFRRDPGLAVLSPDSGRILRRTSTEHRLDRMAYWRAADELLVAAPTTSSVMRFDASTLESRGTIPAVPAVREIAVDEQRGLLICGSLVTGTVSVRDLETGRERASYYLGPWLRTIVLDQQKGRAYVSSNGALYEVGYGH